MKNLLTLKNVTKQYGQQKALEDISMTVEQGDIYGFIGKNGAGKTTFIRLVTQLITASAGSVSFGAEKLKIGAVIEGPACYPYLSGQENLAYYCRQKNIKNRLRVAEVLEFVGLAAVDPKKKFKDYSLGMKQRLGIGIAILDQPDFLILDEPINGLDPQGIVEIREIIRRLNQDFGTTILISSHILAELSLVASRYGIIDQGRLIKELTKEELEAACSQSLRLKTSCDQTAYRQLLAQGYQVTLADEGLSVLEEGARMAEISAALFDEGVYVTQFYMKEQNLEDYYLNIVGV